MRKGRVLAATGLLVVGVAVAAGVIVGLRRTHRHTAAPPPLRLRTPTRRRSHTHARIVAGPHNARVPILMYHVISSPRPQAGYADLYVRPADFAGQMRWLARHGYHAVTLLRVYQYWRKGYALPRRPVVLTFDDGYLSDSIRAMPVLKALHWSGVLNLELRHAEPNDLPVWRIRKLIAAGWEIDAHTITHPDLTAVDETRLRYEVAGSRAAIRRRFHVPVDFFCYPSGRYDAHVLAAVRRAGYFGATTTNYGLARPGALFALARVRIDGSDGVRGFASKLTALSRAG